MAEINARRVQRIYHGEQKVYEDSGDVKRGIVDGQAIFTLLGDGRLSVTGVSAVGHSDDYNAIQCKITLPKVFQNKSWEMDNSTTLSDVFALPSSSSEMAGYGSMEFSYDPKSFELIGSGATNGTQVTYMRAILTILLKPTD